jgi:hypothetical protein
VGRANFTYARATYAYYEEPDYAAMNSPAMSRIGRPTTQRWGYIAERLFIDAHDVATSPLQDFGEYAAGDIKYKDMNGDGVINTLDQAPIGYPATPEINYGFGVSAGYKNWDVSAFFSGSARSSFFVDATEMTPFSQKTVSGMKVEGGLAKFIADDHWTEQNQNPYARWPRLANRVIANNVLPSTWHQEDNSFLRLKSAEIGYSLPRKWAGKLRLSSFRAYLSGTNLLQFSKFNLWDVEMGGNVFNYPLQRVTNIGINLSF